MALDERARSERTPQPYIMKQAFTFEQIVVFVVSGHVELLGLIKKRCKMKGWVLVAAYILSAAHDFFF